MSKKFKATILFISIIVGVAGFMSGCSNSKKTSEAIIEDNYTPVEVAVAAIDSIANRVTMNGKVVANEEISVVPKMVGVVSSVNVELGDTVEEGTILFTIEQGDISKNVEQAANTVEIAKKGVAQAENGVNSATTNYELNNERIVNAKLNLERTIKLYEEGAVSKSQLEQAELAASEKSLDAIKTQINQAEISYQQSLNQLRQAEISYEQAKSGLGNTLVKAPMSGVIASLNVKEGQIVTNSQPAATIVDMDKVYIQINVVENLINKLKVGQEVEINIPAAFDEFIPSTISYISLTPDTRSQLYPIKIYIENIGKGIRPGMNGEVRLNMDQVDSTIVIKSNAVLDKDDKKIVYVVEENLAVEKEVTVGLDTGDFIEIRTGIIAGEKIIVEGQHYVENGGKVKVVRGE